MNGVLSKLKISDVTQLILIVSAVVYVFGFLCFNAYLSSFGFSSIEILSTKYLLSGILTFLSLALALSISIVFLIRYRESKKKKGKIYWGLELFIYIGTIYIFSAVMYSIFSMEPNIKNFNLNFTGSDYISLLVNKYFFTYSSPFKYAAVLFIYSFVIINFIWIMGMLGRFTRRLIKRDKNVSEKIINKTEGIESNKRKTSNNIFVFIFLKLISFFVYPLFISAIIYSFLVISTHIVSLQDIEDQKLTIGLCFSWLFLTTLGFSLLIYITKYSSVSSFSELGKEIFKDPISHLQTALAIVLLSIFSFGNVIFPRISDAIGGGKPKKVNVISSAFPKLSNFSYKSFYLLAQTPSTYLLVGINKDNKRNFIEINRDKIDIFWSGDYELIQGIDMEDKKGDIFTPIEKSNSKQTSIGSSSAKNNK